MKICPRCGRTYPDNFKFCEDCGAFLEDEASNGNGYSPRQSGPYEVTPVYDEPPKKSKTPIVIGVCAGVLGVIIIVCTIVFVYTFKSRSIVPPEDSTDRETTLENNATAGTTLPGQETLAPQAATNPPATQGVLPDDPAMSAYYNVFNNFYITYLDAVNNKNPDLMKYCSPSVKTSMENRFGLNNVSFYDLLRIDFDNSSVVVKTDDNTYTFYTKCVSEKYDRETRADSGVNYAVWKATVTAYSDGSAEVTGMERNDNYKLSEDVYTLNDNTAIMP